MDDAPHDRDHALEVELPFLQRACPAGLEILPVAVGRSTAAAVAALVEALDALVVVSTDLSHYHLEPCRTLDRRTADAVVDRDPSGIADDRLLVAFALRASSSTHAATGSTSSCST